MIVSIFAIFCALFCANNNFISAKLVLVSYGDDNFKISKERLLTDAKQFYNFDEINIYGPQDLSPQFRNQYADILRRSRGGGYWIWRSHVIEEKMKELQYDDILLFVDAGCAFNSQYLHIFEKYVEMLKASDKSMLVFQLQHQERKWTKIEIFNFFNISLDDPITYSGQIMATVTFFKKTPELLKYFDINRDVIQQNPELITDKLWARQIPEFQENRHDQSIFSVLTKILNNAIVMPDITYSYTSPIMATRLNDQKILRIIKSRYQNCDWAAV